MEMHNDDDCIPCTTTGVELHFEDNHWLALIERGVKGLGGDMNTLTCYDSKRQWKKLEIIYDVKDKN